MMLVKKIDASFLRLAGAAIAPAALAACAVGSSTVGSHALTIVPAFPAAAVDLCSTTGSGYVFHGACWQGTLTGKGGATASLAAYKGEQIGVTFGSNDAGTSAVVAVRDALDKGDVTGKAGGKAFPAYKLVGEPVIYLDLRNAAAKSIAFAKTPQIVVTLTKQTFNPNALCGLGFLQGTQWQDVTTLTGKVVKNVLNYAPATLRGAKVTLPAKGDLYAVAWCSGY
jgi:hypothetical protein